MTPPKRTNYTQVALNGLRVALRGRRNHAAWVGVHTRHTRHGLAIEWRDTLERKNGLVAVVPRTENWEETLTAVLEELHNWRAAL